jgi:hypothetical protein
MLRPGVAGGPARLVLAVLLGATAVGCGDGERDNAYVAHSEAGLFLRLPPDWETFQVYNDNPAADPLTDPEAGPWRLVFDGASEPDRAHLEEPTPEDPVGFVEIQPTPQGTGLTSYAEMRSLLGTTESAEPVDPLDSPDFDVLDYEEFDIGGYYGNRLTADTAGGAGDIRVTQIVASTDGADRLYVVRLLCSVECYGANEAEIEAMLDSFTLEAR